MVDVLTNKPLRVEDSEGGPYIDLPLTQVGDVRRLLESENVFYWVQENALSMNGGPYMTMIFFGRNNDAKKIQAILDSSG